MKAGVRRIKAITMCVVATVMLACSHPATQVAVSNSWDRQAAAKYLDYREGSWTEWVGSALDHGTFCVSCHTVVPYALARPALRVALAEQGPADSERRLVDNVTKRVRLWKDERPYYSDQDYAGKTAQSRGTESVLNALILANYDTQRGQLSDDTRAAFDNMWALQRNSGDERGSWPWLQFDEEPWEAKDSVYYGACLAAIAVGTAPGSYAATPGIQDNLKLLRQYLNRESASQSTINHVFLLWASIRLPGLLNSEQQGAIVKEVLSRQQADGGWRLAAITWSWRSWNLESLVGMWVREDGTPLGSKSDGLATGLATLVLQEASVPRDNAQLKRGLTWLMSNQNATDGFWPALSVNRRRNPTSNSGRFMSDAATGYAVLSLTKSQATASPVASLSNR